MKSGFLFFSSNTIKRKIMEIELIPDYANNLALLSERISISAHRQYSIHGSAGTPFHPYPHTGKASRVSENSFWIIFFQQVSNWIRELDSNVISRIVILVCSLLSSPYVSLFDSIHNQGANTQTKKNVFYYRTRHAVVDVDEWSIVISQPIQVHYLYDTKREVFNIFSRASFSSKKRWINFHLEISYQTLFKSGWNGEIWTCQIEMWSQFCYRSFFYFGVDFNDIFLHFGFGK